MNSLFPIGEERMAHHEAGHAFAAFCLSDPGDQPLEEISLEPRDGLWAHVRVNQRYDWGDGREGLERELMVFLGGIVSEDLFHGEAKGGANDLAEIRALLDGADWIVNKSLESQEVRTYLAELRNRLKGEFMSRNKWRLALDQLSEKLIAIRTIHYQCAVELFNAALFGPSS